jgi:aminoglycoside phosphotransferase (APT) family kinase protein
MADLKKIAEGREAEIFAWQDGTVLRLLRWPDAMPQLLGEAAAMRAAAGAGVRVPAPSEVTTVDGRPGLVMERIDGPDLLTLIARRPWTVWSVGRLTGELHAAMHDVTAPDELRPLRERLRQRIEGAAEVPPHLAEAALRALESLPDGDRLCHGDFHPGNVIGAGGEYVVIDWTAVTRGEPTADFVRTDMMMMLGDPPPGSPLVIRFGAKFARRLLRSAYVRSYRRHRRVDPELAERWLLPVAAARLREGIASERPKLLRLLEARVGA